MLIVRKNLFDITIFILLLYITSSLILTFIYDGGSPIDPEQTSFCWYNNHLSDLGRAHYFNGELNPFSFFYNSSLNFLGICVFIFLYLISAIVKNKTVQNIIIFLGILSGIGMLFIGWFPYDLFPTQHKIASSLSFYSFYLAGLLLIIFIDKKQYTIIFYLMLTLIILFISRIFLVYWAKQAGINSETFLIVKALSLKFVIYPQMIFSLIIMICLRKQIPVQI